MKGINPINKMIKILIVDDHQLVIDGIKLMIDGEEDMTVVAEAHNGQEAIDSLPDKEVDVILMDLNMPIMNGLDATKIIHESNPDIKIIGLSMLNDLKLIRKLINYGATGYLIKNAGKEEVINAIKTVNNGNQYFDQKTLNSLLTNKSAETKKSKSNLFPKLSRREKEILQLIMDEFTSNEIAIKLFISSGTVETHRRNIINKLGVRNTAGMIRVVMDYGLLN